MFKYIISIISLLFSHANSTCQDKSMEFNVIIVIDESLKIDYSTIILEAINEDSVKFKIIGTYYPGNFKISMDEYNKIINLKKIKLTFYDHIHQSNKTSTRTYTIDYSMSWLIEYFNIINIYNLNIKKYKKRFSGVKTSEKYVFELDSPDNTFRLR